MMGFGLLIPLILVGVLAYMLGWLPMRRDEYGEPPLRRPRRETSALDILKERYARGEITKAEYEEMREELMH